MRSQRAGFRAIAESRDGGATWSPPFLDKHLICPTCQASVLRVSEKEVIFANPASEARTNLTVRTSFDGGKTWPHARLIDEGPSGYSDLATTRDGRVLCLYECGKTRYNEKIAIVRFSRSWLLQGKSEALPEQSKQRDQAQ